MWHRDQHGHQYITNNSLYCHLCFDPAKTLYPVEGSLMVCWGCRLSFGGNFGKLKDKHDKHEKKAKSYEISFQDPPLSEFIEGMNGFI